jgi:hypothetical protein
MISNLSGFFLSTIIPHMIDEIMNIPPYAAYVFPKCDGWNVGIRPYRIKLYPRLILLEFLSSL